MANKQVQLRLKDHPQIPARPFQFRISDLLAVMAGVAIFCALAHYQSALGMSVFFAVWAVVLARCRIPFRFTYAGMLASVSMICLGLLPVGAMLFACCVLHLFFVRWVTGAEAHYRAREERASRV